MGGSVRQRSGTELGAVEKGKSHASPSPEPRGKEVLFAVSITRPWQRWDCKDRRGEGGSSTL